MIDVIKKDNIVVLNISQSNATIPFCFEFEKECKASIDDFTKVLVITSEIENFAPYCHIDNQNDCIGLILSLIHI